MDIYRKFCIRKADLIGASIDHVATNTQAKTVTVVIKETENYASRMSLFLRDDEAKRLMDSFRVALAGFDDKDAITEAQRLDWTLTHQAAEFSDDQRGPYAIAYLDDAEGVSGHFIARGATYRDCIDAFIRGEMKRID